MSAESFAKPQANVIVSELGRVEVRGRAGLDVTYRGEQVQVDSEMLAGPKHVVVYTGGRSRVPSERADEIYAFVARALRWDGFEVDFME